MTTKMGNDLFNWLERLGGLLVIAWSLAGPLVGWRLKQRQDEANIKKAEADAGKTGAEIFQVHSAARKLDAETLATITAVYQNLVNELKSEVVELNGRMEKLEVELEERDGRIERLEKENRELRRHVTQLEKQLNGKEDKA